MDIAGWVVWALVLGAFLWYLNNFGLASERGLRSLLNAQGVLFCAAIVGVLGVTALTTVSRFHLLWFFPVAYLVWFFVDATRESAPAPVAAVPSPKDIPVLDLTSEEYKRMAEQVMRGERAAPSLEALYQQLVEVAEEGLAWQRSTGTTHVADDYPQYQRFHDLGVLIHQKGGLKGMQRACLMLRQKGGVDLAWTVESAWKGIGGWWP